MDFLQKDASTKTLSRAAFSKAVTDRAVKDSFFASALDAAAYRFHYAARLDERLVTRLIAPSRFVKEKFWNGAIGRAWILFRILSTPN